MGGLQRTVLAPELLDESIDSASIHEIMPGRLRREIRRGRCATSDEVEPAPQIRQVRRYAVLSG